MAQSEILFRIWAPNNARHLSVLVARNQDVADDGYQGHIISAAIALVEHGRDDWQYITGHTSGSTVWRSPDNQLGCIVKRTGEIND